MVSLLAATIEGQLESHNLNTTTKVLLVLVVHCAGK